MPSLKNKFILGSAGLVAILALSSAVGVTVAWRASRAVEKMLRANYDTLMFCQAMVDATGRLDTAARLRVSGRESADWAPAQKEFDENLGSQQTNAREPNDWDAAVAEFDKNLASQQANVTEPGEQQLTDGLAAEWGRFKRQVRDFRSAPPTRRRQIYEKELQPQESQLLLSCHDIAGVNLKAVPLVEQRARRLARDAAQWGLILLALATVLVSGGVAFLGRWVINPIRAVTESAGEIAAGNLDLEVQAAGQDEVGQLAASFNKMSARLREFRRSDRARLIQFQRGTQRALDALSDGVAFMDSAGLVELANPVADHLFGLRAGGPPGPGCPVELSELLAHCLRGATGFAPSGYGSALQVFDDGTERFFLPRAEAVNDEGGRLAGLALVLVDVTGLRRMDEMKSGVLATVSHELKTPLTGLRMAMHLLLNERTGPLNPQQEELALSARQDAERLHRILTELLDIGRLESGRNALALKPEPARELPLEAMEQLRAAYQSKGVELKFDWQAGSVRVQADSVRLRHVFTNLLDNALRFTPAGGRVTVAART
ncbi:MAG TPA: histidine kinase dimerization/phospho-acceptor domain-containing protein, partial [bacterium]|nr:histidine kinase dimerization/phospho-acceptor domain-containing protein [bacterium]